MRCLCASAALPQIYFMVRSLEKSPLSSLVQRHYIHGRLQLPSPCGQGLVVVGLCCAPLCSSLASCVRSTLQPDAAGSQHPQHGRSAAHYLPQALEHGPCCPMPQAAPWAAPPTCPRPLFTVSTFSPLNTT